SSSCRVWWGGCCVKASATGARLVDFAKADGAARTLVQEHLHTAVDRAKHPLATINDIAMRLGLLVHVPASDPPAEIELDELGAGIERILVVVEPNASATLVERPAAPMHRVVECVLGEGARVDHVRLQPPSESVEYHLVAARLGTASRYRLAQYSQGAALRRNDLHVAVAGRGAEVEVHCGYRLAAGTHLDTQVGVEHEATDGVSRQTARGVVGERARAVLNGRIHVAPGAQRTDAALTTKSLLLAPTAQMNAKPELTIYADDVRCAHGATVGELDADALFYLRSRGVTEGAARELLIGGFLAEAVAGAASDDARALLGIAR
ncbi:MAG: SufD family Fe-S cluster assembly protein, partial [Gammaproteobacteria bacterium]|nr:SufD family Fe-S cluster assembly protein [Gammaproteobacteria bacterium]